MTDAPKTIKELIAEVSGLEMNQDRPLQLTFFSHISGKFSDVLNNVDPAKSVAARHQPYRFVLNEPTFVRQITIVGDDLSSYRKIEVEWRPVSTSVPVRSSIGPENNSVTAPIGAVVTEFSITPPDKFFGTSTIKSVTVNGMPLPEFLQASEQVAIAMKLLSTA